MKLLIRVTLLSVVIGAMPVLAETQQDNQAFIESMRDKNDAMQKQKAPVPLPFTSPRQGAFDEQWINSLKKQQQPALSGPEKPQPKALYFVSFSIPEAGLKLILQEAADVGIPSVLNGLMDDDFAKTAGAVFNLVKEDNRGGVQIDPVQFRTYNITHVPALVVICGDKSDVISGSIRIKSALEQIVRDGDCPEVAQELLGEKSHEATE
ncbi:type-F conjugative transfer system pilin assembly protein TrbC [Yersinia pseudotuberculosis]|uniref:type-F conjugative transfer system pilin assembly protein TrbC n=1 Tax=Yersinia pseudotuberculosis TaxID=633 RepID=UPI002B2EC73A|nr:type-F conjugative transfer system pilin assembly protein TrbC [Yersinia pseudotuberculosis]